MIKLEHVVLASPEQMEFIIEGMRNPMNSWEKSDSEYLGCEIDETDLAEWFKLGKNDHSCSVSPMQAQNTENLCE